MNILIVSQYFWPENFIINDLVLNLQSQGHSVSIFTGKPNYPDGDIFEGYSAHGVQNQEYVNGIPIFRVPLRPRKKGGKNLALNYLSFVTSGLRHAFGFSKNKKFDAIFVFAISPITAAIPAIFLKWRLKSHLAIWVQDLWPESVSASGYSNNRVALTLLKYMVKGIYFFCDTILIQSQAFATAIEKLANKEKIIYYPNSVMDTQSSSHEISVSADLDYLLQNYFCIVFAGNIGTVQAVETLLQAAILVKDTPHIKILIIGSGSKFDWLKNEIEKHQLVNLVLAGRYPSTYMPYIYSKACGLLVSLNKNKILSYTIPSKVQAYLCAGKPIIASLDGEGARVIYEANAGYTSAAEDVNELVINIKKLYNLSPSERNALGEAGRSYFLKHFEMKKQSKNLIKILSDRIIFKENS